MTERKRDWYHSEKLLVKHHICEGSEKRSKTLKISFRNKLTCKYWYMLHNFCRGGGDMYEILHEILTNFWTIAALYVQTVHTQQILSKNVSVFHAKFHCRGGGSTCSGGTVEETRISGWRQPTLPKGETFLSSKSVNFLSIFTITISMSIEKWKRKSLLLFLGILYCIPYMAKEQATKPSFFFISFHDTVLGTGSWEEVLFPRCSRKM